MTGVHLRRLDTAIIVVALAAASCARPTPRVDPGAEAGPTIRIESSDGRVVTIGLEHYVIGSVLAEADLRGLQQDDARRVAEVQAILARTYALANLDRHEHEGFDLCATTHCQVYRPAETLAGDVRDLVTSATRSTRGLIIAHDGAPINAVFHADCGGSTSDASVAWGGGTPSYLRAVDDSFCLRDAQPIWRFEVDHAELWAALNADPRTQVAGPLREVRIANNDAAGRVTQVVLQGDRSETAVRGEVLRSVLVERFGVQSIKSTRFSVDHAGDRFIFTGRGFGHGIGLCQRGASARAQAGHTPAQILVHYYPATSLKRYH